MGYCGPRGIPLHEFLAWPQESQDAALAWMSPASRPCPGCGTFAEQWVSSSGRPVEAGHWHEKVCPGCQRKQAALEAMQAGADGTRGVFLEYSPASPSACSCCTT